MRPPLTDRKPLALLNRSLIVTAALAATMVAAAFWIGARNKSDDAWVVHSLSVRDQLTLVLSLVQSTETGQRGYLLTGRDDYLAPYTMGVERLPSNLDRLADLVNDNPQQQQALAGLRQLVTQKLDELRSTIDASKAGHPEAALAIVNSDSGFRLCGKSANASRRCRPKRISFWRAGRPTRSARLCCCRPASPSPSS